MKFYNAHEGASDSVIALFELRGRYVYPTHHTAMTRHTDTNLPWFEVRGRYLYQTTNHPDGAQGQPMYEMKGTEVYPTPYNHVDQPSMAKFRVLAK